MTSETDNVLAVESQEPITQNISQQTFIDQFLRSQGRKFRRKFVKESFSDRFKKSINTKKNVIK